MEGGEAVIQRWLCTDEQALEFDDNGAFVLYIDHLAAMKWWEQELSKRTRKAEERGRRDGALAMKKHYDDDEVFKTCKGNTTCLKEALATLPPVGGAK